MRTTTNTEQIEYDYRMYPDKQSMEEALRKICDKRGVLITDTHVTLSKKHPETGEWMHSDSYFDKNRLLIYPSDSEAIGYMTAQLAKTIVGDWQVRHPSVDLSCIVGPAVSGIVLSHVTAYAYADRVPGSEPCALFAEKKGDDFVLTRGFDSLVRGKNVIVVEDVLTSGGSALQNVKAVRAAGGLVRGVVAICNRGDVTAEMLEVQYLHSVMDLKAKSWPESQVPEWLKSRTVRTDIGHGKDYLNWLVGP